MPSNSSAPFQKTVANRFLSLVPFRSRHVIHFKRRPCTIFFDSTLRGNRQKALEFIYKPWKVPSVCIGISNAHKYSLAPPQAESEARFNALCAPAKVTK